MLSDVQRRAIRFFWERTDPKTGLTSDRASNLGTDTYTVASIASTGYALAALPIAAHRGYIPADQCYSRARTALKYLVRSMPHAHGWYYHFVNRGTGQRVWRSEVSSIDTCLLLAGALMAGRYWRGTEVEALANELYDRVDWKWMLTNGGAKPAKLTVSHGWRPESGFLRSQWDSYCELMLIYVLGIGAKTNPLPPACWASWTRNEVDYAGHHSLGGGPLFVHQMAHGYLDFRNQRDALGWDYWQSTRAATAINIAFCRDRAHKRQTYAAGLWGLTACDSPKGYTVYGAPGKEDGTVSPTAMIASAMVNAEDAKLAVAKLRSLGDRAPMGRYGFPDAVNLDAGWFDPDVIGIDLGMAMLAIENYRTGLPWRLMMSQAAIRRAWHAIGFRRTAERGARPLRLRTPFRARQEPACRCGTLPCRQLRMVFY